MITYIIIGLTGFFIGVIYSSINKDIPKDGVSPEIENTDVPDENEQPESSFNAELEFQVKYQAKLAEDCLQAAQYFNKMSWGKEMAAIDAFHALSNHIKPETVELPYKEVYLQLEKQIQENRGSSFHPQSHEHGDR